MNQLNEQAAIVEDDASQEQQPVPQGLMDQARTEVSHETAEDENTNESISHMDNAESTGEDINWEEIERPDDFPGKFWNEKTGPDVDGLGKSYLHLEKKLSEKAPEQYDTTVFEDANIPADDPMANFFTDWCKQNGVKQSSFNELAQKVIGDQVADGEITQQSIAEEKALLGENAEAIIRSNVQWADNLLKKGVISEAEHQEIDYWGGTAAGSSLLQKVRAMTGENISIPVQAVSQHSQSADEFNMEIQSLMSDPRYGTDSAFTKSVERKFEQRFPNK